MGGNGKRTKTSNQSANKNTAQPRSNSTEDCKIVWVFDSVDVDGVFAFDTSRGDMDGTFILEKIIQFSRRTWGEIRKDTHDKSNKSQHHFLSEDGLSQDAKDRIARLKLAEKTDQIYSIRLSNKIRIIGLRDGAYFIVKWYDPLHRFYPVG